jgi:hypothetical protein
VTPYLVHIGYGLMLCALVSRDILWLRTILICAQSFLAVYAWRVNVQSIAWWNVAFVAINTVWVIVIVRQRRAVTLSPELSRLHRKYFAALSATEFARLWKRGHRETIPAGTTLTSRGNFPASLYFLLSGEVNIRRSQGETTSLPGGYFIGEMSLLTGEPSTADAVVETAVKVIRWSTDDLAGIKSSDSGLWTKIQSVLGHDLVEKLKRSRLPDLRS